MSMKEVLIEQIKKFSLYHKLKKIVYQTSPEKYNKPFLTDINTNDKISELISSNNPIMITRLGSVELKIVEMFIKNKSYNDKMKYKMKFNAGFFETSNENLDNFAKLYIDCFKNIDMLGISFLPFEDKVVNNYAQNTEITKIRNLEPYFYQNPWSKYLKNKKVLVIHPFTQSIEKQYKGKRELLFEDSSMLPEFELTLYTAVQSLGGNSNFESWFDALEMMKKDISKIDFDVAIIGAGAYGLPLASYVKDLGKKGIHLGGSTQMLFGVYGQRWAIHPDFKDIINDNWIKPNQNEKPQSAKKVENACYW